MQDWWGLLGCPDCRGALGRGAGGAWARCISCGLEFVIEGQVPVLLRQEDVATLNRFSDHYSRARLREGWRPLAPDQARALPYGQPPGHQPLYWQVRRQSFACLMYLLAREGPAPAAGPVADLGAGMGWLAFRLAQVGYQVAVVEASRDDLFGLGAAAHYHLPGARFLPIQGDLSYPPFQDGTLSLILFNASLHYASDLAAALQRASLALQPAGRAVIMDTPIARRPRPGTGQGDRHLGRQELHDALLAAGLQPRWHAIRRGKAWWSHQLRAWVRGRDRFSFPLIVADRQG
jgi:SAM-dependent methyltransferase